MALNASGPISLAGTTAGQSIELENGGNGTTQISLNDTAVRTLAGVASGQITMPTNFWGKSNNVNIEYLIVAGGGAGGGVLTTGSAGGAGGGAGGYLQGSTTLGSGSWFFSVGAGAPRTIYGSVLRGDNGVNTTAFGLTAVGGGGGAGANSNYGAAGGCGGGGKTTTSRPRAGGAGTAGQGYAGTGCDGYNQVGGGGGCGGSPNPAVIGINAGAIATAGGPGRQWVNGTYYGGGGGCGYRSATLPYTAGGIGGGGRGATSGAPSDCSVDGTANTGSGGGGGTHSAASNTIGKSGAGGGSGVVIVRYAGSPVCTGGNSIYSAGGYTYHVFTSSGTLTK